MQINDGILEKSWSGNPEDIFSGVEDVGDFFEFTELVFFPMLTQDEWPDGTKRTPSELAYLFDSFDWTEGSAFPLSNPKTHAGDRASEGSARLAQGRNQAEPAR